MIVFSVRRINTSTSAYLEILHKKSGIYMVTYTNEGTLPSCGLFRTLSVMGNTQLLWVMCSKLSNLIMKNYFLMCKLFYISLFYIKMFAPCPVTHNCP